jgi:hypothetical protein
MFLSGALSVLHCISVVAVRQMCMVCSLFMMAGFMVFRSLAAITRRMLVMVSCFSCHFVTPLKKHLLL